MCLNIMFWAKLNCWEAPSWNEIFYLCMFSHEAKKLYGLFSWPKMQLSCTFNISYASHCRNALFLQFSAHILLNIPNFPRHMAYAFSFDSSTFCKYCHFHNCHILFYLSFCLVSHQTGNSISAKFYLLCLLWYLWNVGQCLELLVLDKCFWKNEWMNGHWWYKVKPCT